MLESNCRTRHENNKINMTKKTRVKIPAGARALRYGTGSEGADTEGDATCESEDEARARGDREKRSRRSKN